MWTSYKMGSKRLEISIRPNIIMSIRSCRFISRINKRPLVMLTKGTKGNKVISNSSNSRGNNNSSRIVVIK